MKFEELVKLSDENDELIAVEKETGKEAVIVATGDGNVGIFWGADDGSDDFVITADEYFERFELKQE